MPFFTRGTRAPRTTTHRKNRIGGLRAVSPRTTVPVSVLWVARSNQRRQSITHELRLREDIKLRGICTPWALLLPSKSAISTSVYILCTSIRLKKGTERREGPGVKHVQVLMRYCRPSLGTRIRHLLHLPGKSHGRRRATHTTHTTHTTGTHY